MRLRTAKRSNMLPLYQAFEEFDQVGVATMEPGCKDHLVEVVEVAHGDDGFQAEEAPGRHNELVTTMAKTAEDGAGDKVGGEDGRMPAGDQGDSEVEADHGVDAEHERLSPGRARRR